MLKGLGLEPEDLDCLCFDLTVMKEGTTERDDDDRNKLVMWKLTGEFRRLCILNFKFLILASLFYSV